MKVSIKVKLLIAFILFPLVTIYIYALISNNLISNDKISYTYSLLQESLNSKMVHFDRAIREQNEKIEIVKNLKSKNILLRDIIPRQDEIYIKKIILDENLNPKEALELTQSNDLKAEATGFLDSIDYRDLNLTLGKLSEVDWKKGIFAYSKKIDNETYTSIFYDHEIANNFFSNGLIKSGVIGLEKGLEFFDAKMIPASLVIKILKQAKVNKEQGISNYTLEIADKGKAYLVSNSIVNFRVVFSIIEKDKTLETVDKLAESTTYFMLATICLSTIFAVLLSRLFSGPVLKLFSATKKIESGDYDVKLDIKGSDEFTTLARSFEGMASKISILLENLRRYNEKLEQMVEERTAQLNEAMNLQKAILESLGQGFFIFNNKGEVLQVSSKAAEEMYLQKVNHKSYLELLQLPEEERLVQSELIEEIFNESQPFEDMKLLLVKKFDKNKGRFIFMDYHPYQEDSKLKGIIVVSTDKTDELRYQKLAIDQKNYSDLIIKIIQGPRIFLGLFNRISDLVRRVQDLDEKGFTKIKKQILLEIHGLKGGFLFYKFLEASNKIHSIEEILKTDNSIKLAKNKFKELETVINEFKQANHFLFAGLLEYQEEQIQQHEAFYASQLQSMTPDLRQKFKDRFMKLSTDEVFNYLNTLSQELALNLGKKLDQITFEKNVDKVDRMIIEVLLEFAHLIRNSLVHGIESPLERSQIGKKESGSLSIKLIQESESFKIIYADDGRGVDFKAIREKYNLTASEDEIISKILKGELSSNSEADLYSGRGIGVAAVYNVVKENSGSLELKSTNGKGLIFHISFTTRSDA